MPLPSITHNDYLLLDDRVLFCAFGDSHRADSVLGMPYYVPHSVVKGMGFGVPPTIKYRGIHYVKLENPAVNPVYSALINNNASNYTWVNRSKTALVWVRRSHITRTFSPRMALKSYLRRSASSDPIAQLIGIAYSFDRELPRHIGLSGSTMLCGRRVTDSSDVDLIVYGQQYPRVVQAFCTEIVEKHGYKYMGDAHYAVYSGKRAERYVGLGTARERLLRRRWDTVVSPRGDIIDFSFSRQCDGPRWFEWQDLEKVVTVNATVIDDSDSFFAPSLLRVQDNMVTAVCITSRGYCCLFKRGDAIVATGRLHEQPGGQQWTVLVDETAGDSISISR